MREARSVRAFLSNKLRTFIEAADFSPENVNVTEFLSNKLRTFIEAPASARCPARSHDS